MTRTIIAITTVAALLAACTSGGSGQQAEAESADSAILSMAVLPTLDCLPLYVASERGMFERQGLDLRLLPCQAQMDADTAITGRSACIMATDLVRMERLAVQGTRLTPLTATEALWQLLTGRTARIRQLRQLDDKMLAMTRYSATDMLGCMAVDSAQLPQERVFRIQVNDLGVRLGMFHTATIDAMMLPEPQATAARRLKAYTLLDCSKAFDLRLGVVAMREGALSTEQAEAFRRAYDEACDSINERGLKAYRDIITQRMGVDKQTVDSLPQDMHFGHATMPRQRDMERTKDWLTKKLNDDNVEKQYAR